MTPHHFLRELQRRHVPRVVGAYAFAAWVAVEVYTTIQPILFPTAEWSNRVFVILALAGFPIVFALAWVFDITPLGIRRTLTLDEMDGAHAAAPATSGDSGAGRRTLSPRATGFFGLGILVALVSFAAYAGFNGGVAPAAATEASAIRSIAVLPFTNMSGGDDQDYFSAGIAEELLNRLTQVPDLKVPARTSSFAFENRGLDIREIGRQLGVQAVLEGSVRREGETVRVTAQLIDAATGYHIWSDTFEGQATHVFALQDEISDAIMTELELRIAITPEAGERGTSNVRAHELYLLGLQRWHQRTDRDLRQALTWFRRAVETDPEFALAHAALARTYAVLPAYGDFPVDTAVMRGSAAAAQAIALDPSLAEAYAAMGQIAQNFEWDFEGAERFYLRALDYSNSVTAHQWYAETLMMLGRYDESEAHIRTVIARDALSPVALYVDAFLKTVRGATDEGLAAWSELMRLHPEFELGLLGASYAAAAAGRSQDAATALDRLQVLIPARAPIYTAIAAGLREPGRRSAALIALQTERRLSPSERAAWQAALGGAAAAIATLEAGHRQHTDANLPYVLVHPLMEPLREHPRFLEIIADVGVAF